MTVRPARFVLVGLLIAVASAATIPLQIGLPARFALGYLIGAAAMAIVRPVRP